MSTEFACHHLLDLHECDGTLVVVLRAFRQATLAACSAPSAKSAAAGSISLRHVFRRNDARLVVAEVQCNAIHVHVVLSSMPQARRKSEQATIPSGQGRENFEMGPLELARSSNATQGCCTACGAAISSRG